MCQHSWKTIPSACFPLLFLSQTTEAGTFLYHSWLYHRRSQWVRLCWSGLCSGTLNLGWIVQKLRKCRGNQMIPTITRAHESYSCCGMTWTVLPAAWPAKLHFLSLRLPANCQLWASLLFVQCISFWLRPEMVFVASNQGLWMMFYSAPQSWGSISDGMLSSVKSYIYTYNLQN